MTDQESERPGGTQPGLKKVDLLTRQTGDGSFEFIAESDASESYSYEAEPGVSLHDESQLPISTRDKKPVFLIGGVVLLLIVLISAGVAFSKIGNEQGERDTKMMDQEVSGFRPYGGSEAAPRAERPSPERNTRSVKRLAEPIEEPQEQFVPETFDESPSSVVPESETEWQVGENELIREEDENLPSEPVRSMARDRINLQNLHLRGMDSEKIRQVSERGGRASSRQMEAVRQGLQADEAAQNNLDEARRFQKESQGAEEEHLDESAVEDEGYEEEELDEEIY